MQKNISPERRDGGEPPERVSFVSCVADFDRYAACRRSIESLERGSSTVEILPIDNSAHRLNAAQALNEGWQRATGDLLVFCHEDVEFPPDWLRRLHAALAHLERTGEAHWGLVGPIGRRGKEFAGAIADDVQAVWYGQTPATVDTLDELCLVARRELPFRFDVSLGGFHLYGVDLAIQCIEGGYRNFALDLFLRHHTRTRGKVSRTPSYRRIRKKLQRKWRFGRRRVGRVVGTTSGTVHLGWLHGWC